MRSRSWANALATELWAPRSSIFRSQPTNKYLVCLVETAALNVFDITSSGPEA